MLHVRVFGIKGLRTANRASEIFLDATQPLVISRNTE